jgi:phosphotransferase system enzyme I (PtsI)
MMDISTPRKELRLKGLAVSGGMAMARVFRVSEDVREAAPHYTIDPEEVREEQARLQRAIVLAADSYEGVVRKVAAHVGNTQANIFRAQKSVVEDDVLFEEMAGLIARELINAETAVQKVLNGHERTLNELDDDYIRGRSSDIAEVRRRLIAILTHEEKAQGVLLIDNNFRLGERRIIMADELTPGLTVGLDASHTAGFITERGGRASHSALLARALGIPAVSGLRGLKDALGHGEEALINGDSGEVILWPSEDTLRVYPGIARAEPRPPQAVAPVPGLQVMANINVSTDVDAALAMHAEGIGLYRTEYEFLTAGRVLDEEEQFARYSHVLRAMGDRPVYFRLLDLGGDKSGAFMELPEEENPVLGLRGARLLEDRPEMLIAQTRALARCSLDRPVYLMYPMIDTFEQFIRLRELVLQYAQEIPGARLVHGVMFEVPSAVFDARRIFQVAEFGFVGSNDLTQYLFAVDRGNDRVAHAFKTDQPAFWAAVGYLANAARRMGRPLAICGEVSSKTEPLARLLDFGIHQFSLSSRMIGVLRTSARQIGIQDK